MLNPAGGTIKISVEGASDTGKTFIVTIIQELLMKNGFRNVDYVNREEPFATRYDAVEKFKKLREQNLNRDFLNKTIEIEEICVEIPVEVEVNK